MIEDERNGKKI